MPSRPAVFLVMAIGTGVLVYAFSRASLELRLFIVFAFLILAASLSKPLIGGGLPQWQLLAIDRSARYWFFPMLAVLWSLLYCAAQKDDRRIRIGACVTFAAMLHGMIHDHRYPPLPDRNFQIFLRNFEAAPSGTYVLLPDCPPGEVSSLRKK